MEFPNKLFYTKDHEWISATSGQALVGVSEFAIDQLGDIVHIELPETGTKISAGDSFGTIESTKTVSDLYAPGSGTIVAVNEAIKKNPERLQQDAYKDGWLIKVELTGKAPSDLMDASSYENYIKE